MKAREGGRECKNVEAGRGGRLPAKWMVNKNVDGMNNKDDR